MVHTDTHAHTLIQINTWLEKTSCTITVPTGMITPKTSCTYKAAGTFDVTNVLIYKCHSLQNSAVFTHNSKNENIQNILKYLIYKVQEGRNSTTVTSCLYVLGSTTSYVSPYISVILTTVLQNVPFTWNHRIMQCLCKNFQLD